MFNFEKINNICKNTTENYSNRISTMTNMYTTQILRNFKPNISLNLLEVYLQTYNDHEVYANLNKIGNVDKILNLYNDRLIRFIDNSICKRIQTILNTDTCQELISLQDTTYKEFNSLLNYKKNEACPFQLADNLRRSLFANNNVNTIYTEYCDGPAVKKSREYISKDQQKMMKEIIVEASEKLAFGDKFEYGEKFDSFISMLYIYTVISSEDYAKVQNITTMYDLFKFGNNDVMHSFIGKDSDKLFANQNTKDNQYVDLTTALCMCPAKKYNLTIDDTQIKDMHAYNLLRLELLSKEYESDCVEVMSCNNR